MCPAENVYLFSQLFLCLSDRVCLGKCRRQKRRFPHRCAGEQERERVVDQSSNASRVHRARAERSEDIGIVCKNEPLF